ncbi:MAG TPA: tripartite tricarboxylate transporter substrate binding protein [Burkholderiaceae bacterium]|nr:tripartite tricarboxylate transporter substrate binding protein [Burkholderiaceae bacterium]
MFKLPKILKTTAAVCTALLLAGGQVAHAQSQRPITLVVPFSPGGSADVSGRTAAMGMEKVLGQTIVVENKPGASGMIGAAAVAQAAPDGNTLYLTTDSTESNPTVDPAKVKEIFSKLEPLASIADAPLVLATATSFPANSVPELIEHAKSSGKPLTYAIPGVGTTHQLAGAVLAEATGIQLTAVPYRGTSATIADVVSGVVDLAFGNLPSIQPMVEAGKLKILAVTSLERYKLAPNLPTISETVPGFDLGVNLGLMVPAGTPPERKAQLADAVRQALEMEEVRQLLNAQGLEPAVRSLDEYGAYLKRLGEERRPVYERLGIKPN